MSDIIELLARQSNVELDANVENFARLIIRECADLIDNQRMITAAETYDEVFVAGYNAREESAKLILQHFGVKE